MRTSLCAACTEEPAQAAEHARTFMSKIFSSIFVAERSKASSPYRFVFFIEDVHLMDPDSAKLLLELVGTQSLPSLLRLCRFTDDMPVTQGLHAPGAACWCCRRARPRTLPALAPPRHPPAPTRTSSPQSRRKRHARLCHSCRIDAFAGAAPFLSGPLRQQRHFCATGQELGRVGSHASNPAHAPR